MRKRNEDLAASLLVADLSVAREPAQRLVDNDAPLSDMLGQTEYVQRLAGAKHRNDPLGAFDDLLFHTRTLPEGYAAGEVVGIQESRVAVSNNGDTGALREAGAPFHMAATRGKIVVLTFIPLSAMGDPPGDLVHLKYNKHRIGSSDLPAQERDS